MTAPLTVGTAGHIDHGKTELVRALTGVDTERLPEERARGITIVLGYALLRLPSGRTVSLVDVPGHERLVRTMVAGASGIDLLLLALAADDGVMPQTREHLRVLRALGVSRGVVAVTKADLADPAPASAAAAELLPGLAIVPCSARTGQGIAALAAALDRAAADTPSRAADGRPATLHVDRVFTIRGAGTVVTGTLWHGTLRRGDRVRLLPDRRVARIRGLQIHDSAVEAAPAGQRVAVNLAGIDRDEIAPGDVVAGEGSPVAAVYRLEAALEGELEEGTRVQVHHGTRDVPARLRRRGEHWELRLERPLLAAAGDRLVIRRISPPDTVGGGIVLARAERPVAPNRQAVPATAPPPAPPAQPPLSPAALVLERRLRDAGHEPPGTNELGELAGSLPALLAAGRAVRVGRALYAHPDALDHVSEVVRTVIAAEGSITLARLRDELGTSRRYAQALLEYLDAARVTRRLPDDSRVLRRGAPG